MTYIHIILEGRGGELDRREVATEEQIADALAKMGPFAAGDIIRIVETEVTPNWLCSP